MAPAGYYVDTSDHTTLLQCNDGDSSREFSLGGASACTECPKGYECVSTASAPTICPIGTWSVAGQASCTECAAGEDCPYLDDSS